MPRRCSSAISSVVARMAPRRPGRAVARGVVEHEHLGRERRASRARRAIASRQRSEQLALLGVDDAEGHLGGHVSPRHGGRVTDLLAPVRVHVVDPSAYTPPYDHALCAALAAPGATSRWARAASPTATCPRPEGYSVTSASTARAPARRARAARRARRAGPARARHAAPTAAPRARRPTSSHFQWLTVQPLDVHLLPRAPPARADRARRPAARAAPRAARRRSAACYERVDAVVVHSEHGRRRLVDDARVDTGVGPRDPARRLHASARRARRAPAARRARRPCASRSSSASA